MAAKKAAAKAAPKKPKPITDKQTKAQIITSIVGAVRDGEFCHAYLSG